MVINKKKYIDTMVDYAEGRLSTYDFWNLFCNERKFRKLIKKEKKEFPCFYDDLLYEDLTNYNITDRRLHFYGFICAYLNIKVIEYVKNNVDYNNQKMVEKYLSSWMPILSFDSFLKLIGMTRDQLEKANKKQIKDILISKFKYKEKKPIWLQDSEWPIVNDVPLTFIRQTINPNSKNYEEDPIDYIFLNEETNEKVIVTQFD